MFCLKHSQFFIELLVIDPPLGPVDKDNTNVGNQEIECKQKRCGQVSVKPSAQIRNYAIEKGAYRDPGILAYLQLVAFIKIAEKINLDITYYIAGKNHFCQMNDTRIPDAVHYFITTVEKKDREEVEACFEFYSDFFGQIRLPYGQLSIFLHVICPPSKAF